MAKGGGDRRSPVGGHRIITGLIPSAAIPDEILTDHPDRFRAMLIESANPVHSLPDCARMREALAALDCVVVIDVAMTETARCADYVLPAASQYEKWEATFFTLEFPENAFQLRAPILDPLPGTLPEPEIHRRLTRALGAYTDDDLVGLHAAAAQGRAAFADAFLDAMVEQPHLASLAPDRAVRDARSDAWARAARAPPRCGASRRRASSRTPSRCSAPATPTATTLFDAMLANPSGVVFTVDDYDETWRRLDTPDGKVNLVIPDLLEELSSLPTEVPTVDAEFPFVLSAGERRSSHREHDLPRSVVEEEGRRRRAAHAPRATPPRWASKTGGVVRGRHPARGGRGAGRDHRRDAARPREPAQRPRPAPTTTPATSSTAWRRTS